MDHLPPNLAILLIAVAVPTATRTLALVLISLIATLAPTRERRHAAQQTLTILLGRRGTRRRPADP